MINRTARRPALGARSQSGFTLIEVMVAVLVLAFGLLGFALLQTMSVRFVQSSNYRTQATNLAYEMLDQIRVNRVMASSYFGDYTGTTRNCVPDVGAITVAQYKTAWSCRLGKTLGEGATATVSGAAGDIVLDVSWGDERWVKDADPRKFSVRTRL